MATRSSGGIGRRAGFKIQFFRECGFDSHLEYLKPLESFDFRGFFYFFADRKKAIKLMTFSLILVFKTN